MNVALYTVGPLMTNCYLITCKAKGTSVLVDPGGISVKLEQALEGTNLTAIVLTHGHFDHTAGLVPLLRKVVDVPVMIHSFDAPMLTDPFLNGSFMLGTDIIPDTKRENILIKHLVHGDSVWCGDSSLSVVHTPGHSPGSISLIAENEFVLSGDTLFHLSVGRWDLPGGNYYELKESIDKVYRCLPDSMALYPGHGEPSTIGYEKRYNQFLE